jgi:DNA replication protein DnaC
LSVDLPAPPRLKAPASATAAALGSAFDEAVNLTKTLKLPHIRRAMTEVIPTAKAQRWDPAEIVRVLLAEEAAGRAASNLRTRRQRAQFPTGKTFHIWNEQASSIPIPTQASLRTLEWIGRQKNLCVCGPRAPARATSPKPSARPRSTPG